MLWSPRQFIRTLLLSMTVTVVVPHVLCHSAFHHSLSQWVCDLMTMSAQSSSEPPVGLNSVPGVLPCSMTMEWRLPARGKYWHCQARGGVLQEAAKISPGGRALRNLTETAKECCI